MKSTCESAAACHQNHYTHSLGKQTAECTSDSPTVYHLLHVLPSAGFILLHFVHRLPWGTPRLVAPRKDADGKVNNWFQ